MDLDNLAAWAKEEADKLFWANVDKDQAKLAAELEAWLAREGFSPNATMEEAISEALPHQAAWIENFCQRWDACSPLLVDGVWMRQGDWMQQGDAKGK